MLRISLLLFCFPSRRACGMHDPSIAFFCFFLLSRSRVEAASTSVGPSMALAPDADASRSDMVGLYAAPFVFFFLIFWANNVRFKFLAS
jgi:hypothetical protein